MKKNISNSGFKVVVVGMGVQGEKRAQIAGKDLLATVDVIRIKPITIVWIYLTIIHIMQYCYVPLMI